MNVKENLAKNLVKYRKFTGLTQAELAEKLNYSDKAVSKWERGESVPDLVVLKQIADFYGVKIDTLISKPNDYTPHTYRNITKIRFTMAAIATVLVWLAAALSYFFIELLFPSFKGNTWLAFVIAVPLTMVVLSILTSVWKNSILNVVFHTLLVWSTLTTLYLILKNALIHVPYYLWVIFLIVILFQALILFMFFYKRFNKNQNQ